MNGPTNRVVTLDQRRAKHAWATVEAVVQRYKKDEAAKQFGRAAKKLPPRILASGLGQSLAFLAAKDKTPLLLAALSDWVLNRGDAPPAGDPSKEAQRKLLRAVVDGTTDSMRRHTDETLAYLRWLVRFADAEGLTEGEDAE